MNQACCLAVAALLTLCRLALNLQSMLHLSLARP